MKPSKPIDFLFIFSSVVIWMFIVAAKYAVYDTNLFLIGLRFFTFSFNDDYNHFVLDIQKEYG